MSEQQISEEKEEDPRSRAEHHFQKFMESLGLDVEDDEHLEETPERVVRSRFDEIFRGLNEDPTKHLDTTFTAESDDFVIVDNIEVKSMCGHHFLPFRGEAHIGYIPNNDIVGLSKFARLVDGYARRPQVQERLTREIADAIRDKLNPKAAIVVIEAEHECMSLRGVQDASSVTRTSAIRMDDGLDKHSIKQEFFQMVDGL